MEPSSGQTVSDELEIGEVQVSLPDCLLAGWLLAPACRLRSAPAMRGRQTSCPAGPVRLYPYRLPDRAAARPARQLAAPRVAAWCWLLARMLGSEDGGGTRRSRGTERARRPPPAKG